jgi:hypothetical protein
MARSDIDPRFFIDLNQQRYYFKITMYNGLDSPVEFTYPMVDQLTIEESLHSWNTVGCLVLRNEYEIIERGSPENNTPPLYTFRHDARNKVNVRIFPVFDPKSKIAVSTNPKVWEINYDFIVYNIEDVPANDLSKKKKKLYLWDERYQHFLERNIQWSTYYVAENLAKEIKDNPEEANNILTDRVCRVGDAIYHLIQTACGENDINGTNQIPLTVGWDPDTPDNSISKPNLKVARFNQEWDRGSDLNLIFYTSPATTNVLEDLEYLLKYFVSEKNLKDNKLGLSALLLLDRYTKKWSLMSLDTLYDKCTSKDGKTYGENVIERFFIQSTTSNSKVKVGGNAPTPTFVRGEIINGNQINAGPSSLIYSYKFVQMSSLDDLLITNKPVVNYKNNESVWHIYGNDGKVENTENILQKDFIPKLYKTSTSMPLININKDKKNGLNTSMQNIVVQSDAAGVFTRNAMVMDSIFLNQAIEFDSQGLTIRTPGKFISIEREVPIENNTFENKFTGQWLITRTTHNFYQDKYTTNVVAVKINGYSHINAYADAIDKFNE